MSIAHKIKREKKVHRKKEWQKKLELRRQCGEKEEIKLRLSSSSLSLLLLLSPVLRGVLYCHRYILVCHFIWFDACSNVITYTSKHLSSEREEAHFIENSEH